MRELNKMLHNVIRDLDKWIEENGWAGYDPYDIKDIPIVRKLTDWGNKNYLFEIIREICFEFFLMFPVRSRKLLSVNPEINAKAMGLFVSSYLNLHEITKEKKYLVKVKHCLRWLEDNFNKDYPGMGWGYPFNWQSKKLIPKNTPNGIVTTVVGEAFWNYYNFSKDEKYLNMCDEICQFLISLPIDHISKDKICFAYTPIYINHVHNLNLFVAEFLIKIGTETDNREYLELGNKALKYTLESQFDDGSFDYNGPPEKPRNLKDNYHTSFVIRCLYSIWKITGNDNVKLALDKCYYDYVENFFQDNMIPKFTKERLYRIDIHSSAEAMHSLSLLSDVYPEGVKLAKNVFEWTVKNLRDDKGFFYHGIFKSRVTGKPFVSKIPYMRWGQAWMMRGLSSLYKVIIEEE